jgi:2-C-methyl-D-erythritol 4-phosphate cytidylyltransferase
MGDKGKKEYLKLLGKPILAHSTLPFLECKSFTHIVITVRPSHIPEVEVLLEPYLNMSTITLVDGGQTRQRSVYLGLLELEKVNPHCVLIHDGARPWIDLPTINRVLEGARQEGACLPVVATSEAIKEVDDNGFISKHLKRACTVRAQTPQGFLFSRILEAHRRAQELDRVFIDDGEVYAEFFGQVSTVAGNEANVKITLPQDLMPPVEGAT